ncbi:MAG: ABC transporter permease [bacterium]|nr:ABC transporter permease [bacterium]
MNKLWNIAWKDIRAVFTDRNLLLIMLATPLAISTIIALAFSGVAGGGSPLENIPVALVNLDEGAGGFNGGQIFVSALVENPDPAEQAEAAPVDATPEATPGTFELGAVAATVLEATPADPESCEVLATDADQVTAAEMLAAEQENPGASNTTTLYDLTDTVLVDDAAAARAGVENGDYAAAIIIPANFSASIGYSQDNPDFDPVQIEVYGDSGRSIAPIVIRSVVEGITNQMLTGQVAVKSTIDTMVTRAQENLGFGAQFVAANTAGQFNPDFSCAFNGTFETVSIQQERVNTDDDDSRPFNLLVFFGSAQATFFALFTANGGAANILEERRNGTLQRMVVSPTPRFTILLGKLIGVFAMVLLQLVFLFVALTLVNAVLEGEFQLIWGNDWLSIILLLLVTSLATAGVGMLTVAFARTPEQANIVGSVIGFAMGILGGAFFTLPPNVVTDTLRNASVIYWGSNGFQRLASGDSGVITNILFLLVIGAALFVISLIAFNRRQDI